MQWVGIYDFVGVISVNKCSLFWFLKLHYSSSRVVRQDHNWKHFIENPRPLGILFTKGCCGGERVFFLPKQTPRSSAHQRERWWVSDSQSAGCRFWPLKDSGTAVSVLMMLKDGYHTSDSKAIWEELSTLPGFLLFCFVTFWINLW